jgi:hypothetical protein
MTVNFTWAVKYNEIASNVSENYTVNMAAGVSSELLLSRYKLVPQHKRAYYGFFKLVMDKTSHC